MPSSDGGHRGRLHFGPQGNFHAGGNRIVRDNLLPPRFIDPPNHHGAQHRSSPSFVRKSQQSHHQVPQTVRNSMISSKYHIFHSSIDERWECFEMDIC